MKNAYSVLAMMFFALHAMAADEAPSTAVVKEDQPMAVNAAVNGGGTPPPSSGMATRSTEERIVFRMYNNCFGTNLRSVANPLAESSMIDAEVDLKVGADTYPLKFSYPASIVTKSGAAESSGQALTMSGLPPNARASYYGNIIQVEIPRTSYVSVDTDGVVQTSPQSVPQLTRTKFFQRAICGSSEGCGDYMGHTGDLNSAVSGFTVSSDNGNVEVHFSFPGQNGFCGGYFSPLMVFFGEERPTFSQIVPFKLTSYRTHWPEKNAPGYFLALDRDKNGKIDNGKELFGDGGKQGWNGFKELALLDTNKDGRITKADRAFSKLLLWNDKNGDGISQKSELLPLSKMKISEISLKYVERDLRSLGAFAQEREHSTFTYVKNGKRKTGKIIDVWLAPVLDSLADK